MATVHVNLGNRSYDVLCDYGLLQSTAKIIREAGLQGKAAIITDSNVAPHYLAAVPPKPQNPVVQKLSGG